MNRHTIEKQSLESTVRLTVEKNPEIRLHRSRILGRWDRNPLSVVYTGNSSVQVFIDIDVKFKVDMMKAVEKATAEITNNLEKLVKVRVKSVQLKIKDVFDEE